MKNLVILVGYFPEVWSQDSVSSKQWLSYRKNFDAEFKLENYDVKVIWLPWKESRVSVDLIYPKYLIAETSIIEEILKTPVEVRELMKKMGYGKDN